MKLKGLVIFLFIITIAGCGKTKNKVKDDIMLARNCGLEELMCCKNEPMCFSGLQCCVNPLDASDNYCAVECKSGKENQFCYLGDKCDDGFICKDNRCLSCGKNEEYCCDGEKKCLDGLVCYKNKCNECGEDGQPCCNGGICNNSNKTGKDRVECSSGICSFCGFDGFHACKEEPKCINQQIYSNQICYQCGGNNQPCCNNDSGVEYKCDQKKGLVCELGFCVKKD